MLAPRPDLAWDGPHLNVDGVDFLVALFRADLTTAERFVVWKSQPLLEASLELIDGLQATRIVELGIAQGGSAALFALYAQPEHLVAVDLSPDPIFPLQDLIDRRGLGPSVHVTYGVDQADRSSLGPCLAPFGDEPIDLVLDDASHRFDETLASFNHLFPLLRPGGVYAVEDWDWAHLPGAAELAASTDSSAWWPGGTALTRLAFLATMATAAPDVVASVTVDRHLLRIARGPGELDPATFDLLDLVAPAGEALLAPLR
jgi:SAM-dependent methyltransferase